MRRFLSLRLSYDTYVRDISIIFLLLLPLTACNAIAIFCGHFLNFIEYKELAERLFYFSKLLISIYPIGLCLITTYYLSSKNNASPMVVMPYALVMFIGISLPNNLVSIQNGLPNNPLLALLTAAFSTLSCVPFKFYPLDPSKINFVRTLYKQAIHFFIFILITFLCTKITAIIIEESILIKDQLSINPLTFSGGLFYQLILGLLSAIGINGHNFLFQSKQQLFELTKENILAWQNGEAALNILGQGFYDVFLAIGGSGSTLSLVVCILLFSKEKRHIIFALSALPLVIFNINELLLFGLPIIFNPILIIPFVLVPLISFVIVYFAIMLQLVNPVATIVDWIMPPFINGYIATQNSFSGVLLQLILVLIGTLVYRPFYLFYIGKDKTLVNSQYQKYEIEKTTLKTYLGDVNKLMNNYMNKHEISKRVNHMLTNGKFVMYYQPQLHLKCDDHIAFESLIRYQDKNGKINPPTFIKYFFEVGAIQYLDKLVIDLVLSDMQAMFSHIDCKIGVNISVETISEPDIVSYISERLNHYQIPARLLELEITEEAILEDHLLITKNIKLLQDIGVKVAIDDFGSGYASFPHLLKFNFDKVKLDRSLLLNTKEERGQNLYQLLAKISEVTGCALVAEGIETIEEKLFVERCGIDICQGFYIAKPMPCEQAIEWFNGQLKRSEFIKI